MTEKWERDTGIIAAIILLVVGLQGARIFLWLSIAVLLVVLFAPKLLAPLAYVWLQIGAALGFVMNRVFFGIVFFLIITPVGLIRRIFTGASLRTFSRNHGGSAFIKREHQWEAADLSSPY